MLVDGAEDFLNAGIIAIPFSPDRSAALDKLKQAMKKYLGAFEDVLVTGQFLVNNKCALVPSRCHILDIQVHTRYDMPAR